MTTIQSNPYAPMLGTIRDLPANNPATIKKILDIIYLQLQLLTTATSALTGTPYAPTTPNPLDLGSNQYLATPQCQTCRHPTPTPTPTSQGYSPSPTPPVDWHKQASPSTISGSRKDTGPTCPSFPRPPHLTPTPARNTPIPSNTS